MRPTDALLDLSEKSDPKQVQNRVAQDAIVHITLHLRKLVKAERWPKPHQIVAGAYCHLAKDRVLIADEPGVGKTAPALLRVLLTGAVPAIVVCPPNVLLNWKAEAETWIPGIRVHRLDRVNRSVPPAGWKGIVVTTWSLLRYHSAALVRMRPAMIIADECHYALNEKAERTQHFEAVVQATPKVLLLSGTPLVNRPKDLWRLLNLLDARAWPEQTLKAFKALSEDIFDKDHQSRLARRLRAFMIRRRKSEALPDLAAKKQQELLVQLSPVGLARYQKAERQFESWLDTKIRQAVPREEFGTEEEYENEVEDRKRRALSNEALTKTGYLQRLIGELKAPLAARWIVEAVQLREPIVAFAYQPSVLQTIGTILTQNGIAYGIIDGATTKTRRFSLVKEFQEKGTLNVLLCTTAAREGITLHRARHVLRVERYWTGAAEDQAADRVHRLGQKRDVTIWTMVARDTIDEHMDRVVAKKRRITARAIDTSS